MYEETAFTFVRTNKIYINVKEEVAIDQDPKVYNKENDIKRLVNESLDAAGINNPFEQ